MRGVGFHHNIYLLSPFWDWIVEYIIVVSWLIFGIMRGQRNCVRQWESLLRAAFNMMLSSRKRRSQVVSDSRFINVVNHAARIGARFWLLSFPENWREINLRYSLTFHWHFGLRQPVCTWCHWAIHIHICHSCWRQLATFGCFRCVKRWSLCVSSNPSVLILAKFFLWTYFFTGDNHFMASNRFAFFFILYQLF